MTTIKTQNISDADSSQIWLFSVYQTGFFERCIGLTNINTNLFSGIGLPRNIVIKDNIQSYIVVKYEKDNIISHQGELVPSTNYYKIPVLQDKTEYNYSFASDLISNIEILKNKNMTERKILLDIVEKIQNELVEKEYKNVDCFLELFNVKAVSTSVLLGILMFTLSWKKSLSSRTSFYNRCAAIINSNHGKEKAFAMLSGLE